MCYSTTEQRKNCLLLDCCRKLPLKECVLHCAVVIEWLSVHVGSSYRLSMVESHNYQQTQHAVCLLMINVLDQCGLQQRGRVMKDSCETFFSFVSLFCFFCSHSLLSAKLDDQWWNFPTLMGFSLQFVDFAFRFETHSNWRSPLSTENYFSIEFRQASFLGLILLTIPCQLGYNINICVKKPTYNLGASNAI